MKTIKFIAVQALLFTIALSALADVPKLINYQGRLTNPAGAAVADSTYSVTFTIYNDPFGSTSLWTETRPITTTDGLFSTNLGAFNTLSDSVFSSSLTWMGIQVHPDPELSPRAKLVSTGYSYRVSSVDGALGGEILSKVSIGQGNINTGTQAFVAGAYNVARGDYSVVSGGGGPTIADSNSALGDYSTIGGGIANKASGNYSMVGGGASNSASGIYSTVSGGTTNTANGYISTISGGLANTATGSRATVSGGEGNSAGGWSATVPGGSGCSATGNFSLAAGRQGKAIHDGSFVWGDGTDAPFSSTASNQFLIRATGGIGIGTNTPVTATGGQVLHVDNPTGPSALRLGDGAVNGKQWEIQSTVIYDGALNFSNVTDLTNPMTIWANGNVGIGKTSPAHPLHMASGAYVSTGGVWTNASSRELKTDIEPLKDKEYTEILEKLEDLDVVHFKYKAEPDVEHIGMIAEDVPDEMASVDRKGIPTADAIAFLVAAVKAQQKQIVKLEKRLKEVERK